MCTSRVLGWGRDDRRESRERRRLSDSADAGRARDGGERLGDDRETHRGVLTDAGEVCRVAIELRCFNISRITRILAPAFFPPRPLCPRSSPPAVSLVPSFPFMSWSSSSATRVPSESDGSPCWTKRGWVEAATRWDGVECVYFVVGAA